MLWFLRRSFSVGQLSTRLLLTQLLMISLGWSASVQANIKPTVDAGSSQVIGLSGQQFTLQGSVSDDGLPIDGVLRSEWKIIYGASNLYIEHPEQARMI